MEKNQQPFKCKYIMVLGPPGSKTGELCDEAVRLFGNPKFRHLSIWEVVDFLKKPKAITDERIQQCLSPDADDPVWPFPNLYDSEDRERQLLSSKNIAPLLKAKICARMSDPESQFLDETWLISGFPCNMDQPSYFERTLGEPLKVIVLDYPTKGQDYHWEVVDTRPDPRLYRVVKIPGNGTWDKFQAEFVRALPLPGDFEPRPGVRWPCIKWM